MNTFNKLTSTVKAAADQAVDAGELWPQRCCSGGFEGCALCVAGRWSHEGGTGEHEGGTPPSHSHRAKVTSPVRQSAWKATKSWMPKPSESSIAS